VHTHHKFFTHDDLSYDGHKDWRALLFPPFAPVMFVLSALPVALIIGNLWSANAGYITIIAMAGYYLMYEGLHTLSHVENSPFLDRLPLVNTVRRMHITHHHPALMQERNFNLTFPICDALFGTSDLKRGLWGTLLNGMSQEHMDPDDRKRWDNYKGGQVQGDSAQQPWPPVDSKAEPMNKTDTKSA
jgi:sterol desaturase/sphingolipid hydroxylase (fatty acid hydroxylase superfamily)